MWPQCGVYCRSGWPGRERSGCSSPLACGRSRSRARGLGIAGWSKRFLFDTVLNFQFGILYILLRVMRLIHRTSIYLSPSSPTVNILFICFIILFLLILFYVLFIFLTLFIDLLYELIFCHILCVCHPCFFPLSVVFSFPELFGNTYQMSNFFPHKYFSV